MTNPATAEKFINWITGLPISLFDAVSSVFNGAGANSTVGLVPNPGNSGTTNRYLNETGSFQQVQYSQLGNVPTALYPRGYIDGFTLSNDATTPNTQLDVAAGSCLSDDGTGNINLTAVVINCSVTGANGLDSGTLAASTWYHVFAIAKTDGTSAALASTSVSSPTMPTGYTLKRRVGSFKTDASVHILAFKQYQNNFFWATVVVEQNSVSETANTDVTVTLSSVPTGVRVQPFFSLNDTGSGQQAGIVPRSPDLQSAIAASNISTGQNAYGWFLTNGASPARFTSGYWPIITNTSAQIIYRVFASGTCDLVIMGWLDYRGQNA